MGADDVQPGHETRVRSGLDHQLGVHRNGGFSRPAGAPRAGTLTAMNPATNRIVWQKRLKFPIGGGSGLLSTAGGLMFHGESDGRLVAWDMHGNEVWSFQTGAGANAPAITYEVAGEQYVAILSGGNRAFQLSAPGDSLWAFKIGGDSACRVGAVGAADRRTHAHRRARRSRGHPVITTRQLFIVSVAASNIIGFF